MNTTRRSVWLLGLLAATGLSLSTAQAASPLHPTYPLLDADGVSVLDSGKAVSPLKTCGACHDTAFISSHGYHHSVGQGEPKAEGARAWDLSPGLYGRWNPLTYDRLSAPGDSYPDLDREAWMRKTRRHAGGGPAAEATPHGAVEANCFLCHLSDPDNGARIQALEGSHFDWAATATLAATTVAGKALVKPAADGTWSYDRGAFDADGKLLKAAVTLTRPRDKQCGQCHGKTADFSEPIEWKPSYDDRNTETTGQIISAQRISASHMNIAGKEKLHRAWDVHAERMVHCSMCHSTSNNPASLKEITETRPEHLKVSARTEDMGFYLKRPNHNLTKGYSSQDTVANNLDGSMRRCEDCHDAKATHEWLPYRERHMQAMLCETCHIPKEYAPARQQTDWTLLTTDHRPLVAYRGLDGPPSDPLSVIHGFEPTILPRSMGEGESKLTPHNLITSWFWVRGEGEAQTPVRRADLDKALFASEGVYHGDVVAALDDNHDGKLDTSELKLDTKAKVDAIAARLAAVGVAGAKIEGEIQPFSLHHGVTTGSYVVKDCGECHSENSRLTRPVELSTYIPFGAEAKLVGDTNARLAGELLTEDGHLIFKPSTMDSGYYVFGHDTTNFADIIGLLALFGILAVVTIHGGLRWWVTKQGSK